MQAPMEKLDSRFRRSLILWIRMTMYWYRITRERESEIRAPAGQSSAVDMKPFLTFHSKLIKKINHPCITHEHTRVLPVRMGAKEARRIRR